MRKLVDVTDRRVRRIQNLACLGSTLLLAVAAATLVTGRALLPVAVGAGLLGLVGLVVASGIRQRWVIDYLGHEIRFENSPITAERLYLDGGLVARGGVGSKMELRAPIRVGPGAGSEVVALCDAGLNSVRVRIFLDHEGQGETHPVATGAGPVSGDATILPESAGADGPAATATAPPAATASAAAGPEETLIHSAAVGRFVLARRAIEFVGSLITIATTFSAVLLWVLGR